MKKASTIISHIKSLPQFRLLKKQYCYQKFIASLAPRIQKSIAFVYVRDNTLFIALSHPGVKAELHYKKESFKDILNMLSYVDKECMALKVSKVVLFNSKYLTIIRKKEKVNMVTYYKEPSLGVFKIKSKDKDLVEAFEKIRSSIKKQL